MNLMLGVSNRASDKRDELVLLLEDEHSPVAALDRWLDKVLLVDWQGHAAASYTEVQSACSRQMLRTDAVPPPPFSLCSTSPPCPCRRHPGGGTPSRRLHACWAKLREGQSSHQFA